MWGVDWKIRPRVTVILREGFFYPHRTTMIDSFFLHTFRSPAFDFNVIVAMNESCCFTLTSTTLKVDVVRDVTMTSTSTSYQQSYPTSFTTNVLTTRVVIRFLSVPRIGKGYVRWISALKAGENRGKPCLVCTKMLYGTWFDKKL